MMNAARPLYPAGSWGVANSLALTTTTDSYPLWFSSRPVLLPAGAPVHYKYCVVADGRLVRSEAIEGSRYMVPQGEPHTLQPGHSLHGMHA